MRGLEGKRILVTGGGSGIGAATAERLGEEKAHLVIGDINEANARLTAERINQGGGSATICRFDLADSDSVEALVRFTVSELGGLDGVANIAADLSPATIGHDDPVAEMDPLIWHKTLDANLIGTALVVKHALPHLIDAGGGSIVNTSSDTHWIGEPVRPAYAASKAGIATLTRHIASAYGKQGVRANGVSPGMVLSETALATASEEFRNEMLAGQALNFPGKPNDIAQTIVFLLSDEAAWVTGQVWSVNGGIGFRS
jgi:NAD(P)-dependent dehydrogenase (short-subunit alcohol dehydrogenase family)